MEGKGHHSIMTFGISSTCLKSNGMMLLMKLVCCFLIIIYWVMLQSSISIHLLIDYKHFAAQRHAVREQKLALELSAAKRERDFYLTQVDKSRALSSIEERMKKVSDTIFNGFCSMEVVVKQQCFELLRLNFLFTISL